VLHVEPAVSGPQAAAALTRGGGRVSHSHGISLTARRCTLPGSPRAGRRGQDPQSAGRRGQDPQSAGRRGRSQAGARRATVKLVPAGMAREGLPA